MRRLRAGAAAAGAAALLAGCADPEGPLKGQAIGTVFEVKRGDPLFWGPIQLQVNGLDAVQVERIEVISDDPAVQVQRVFRQVGPNRPAGGGRRVQDKFGPGELIPATELGVAPRSFTTGDPVDVIVEFRPPTEAGPYAWRGFRIEYRARGRDQVLEVDGPGVACVDRPRSACSLTG